MSSRNLGNNYSLALKTGGGTHLTLLYIRNCKRGYEQERVKAIANEYILKILMKQEYHLDLKKHLQPIIDNTRCLLVTHPELIALQKCLFQHLTEEHGFDPKQIEMRPLHIDLRGQSMSILDTVIPLTNWNH